MKTWGAGSGALCLCSCCPVAFCYATRCVSASLLYLRLCACSCLLVLLAVLLLLVLVTRLHDHARCLCCRGGHCLQSTVDDVHLRVLHVGALLVIRVLGGVVRWHLVAGGKLAASPLAHPREPAGSNALVCTTTADARCPCRRSGCPCTRRRAWPRAPPSGSRSSSRGLPRCRCLLLRSMDFGNLDYDEISTKAGINLDYDEARNSHPSLSCL